MKQLLFLLLILGSLSSIAQKITDLPAATGTGVGGVIPIVQGGVTKRIFIDSLPKTDTTTIYTKINQNTAAIGTKQNTLTAGTNITIVGNTINSSGGGITNYDSAFVDFTTDVNNQVLFRRKNAASQILAINFPSSLSSIRRLPGTLQVQGLVSGVWTNQDFIDSIGGGGAAVVDASPTQSGVVNIVAQSFAGNKTFSGDMLRATNINAGGVSNNDITGSLNLVNGAGNSTTGVGNMNIGSSNNVNTNYSGAIGGNNSVTGQRALAAGFSNTVAFDASVALGEGNITKSEGEVAVGMYNADYTRANTTADRLFSLGFGASIADRKDLIRANKNGEVILHSTAVLIMVGLVGKNFTNDTTAAAGGIVLGGLYHTAGTVKIRIL